MEKMIGFALVIGIVIGVIKFPLAPLRREAYDVGGRNSSGVGQGEHKDIAGVLGTGRLLRLFIRYTLYACGGSGSPRGLSVRAKRATPVISTSIENS